MNITINEITEEALDRCEDAFANIVNVHTTIWPGTAPDCFQYVIEVYEEVDDTEKDYNLMSVVLYYRHNYYTLEIVNESQIGNVELHISEIQSILIK